jgi:hypothetical protein
MTDWLPFIDAPWQHDLQLDLQHVLLLYLSIGMLTFAVSLAKHLWSKRHEWPDWLRGRAGASWRDQQSFLALLAEMDPKTRTRWYRFRELVLAPILTVLSMVLLWPLAWKLSVGYWLQARRQERDRLASIFKVQPQHRTERLTIEQIEVRELVEDPLRAVPSLPFGHLHPQWAELKASLQPGDELWAFATPWPGDLGLTLELAGYVRSRRRKPLAHILTVRREVDEDTAGAGGSGGKRQAATVSDKDEEIEIPAFLRKDAD